MGGGESQQEKQSKQNQQQQQQMATTAEQNTQNTLNQYTGDVTKTPYYQGLLRAGTTSTNQAYDNSNRNLKLAMQGAGLSGASGVAAGAGAQQAASRAGALGQVKNQAIEGATQQQDTALGLQNNLAATESGAAQGYNQAATQLDIQRQQQQNGLFGAMLQAGGGLATDAIEGASWFA